MDSKDVNQADETQKQGTKGEKGRQNTLLIALIALVGGFSYLYFFTDMIRTQEVSKPAETPATQKVKMELPPRDGSAAKAEPVAAAGDKKEAAAPAVSAPVKVVPAAPVTPAPIVAATPQPKPKEEPKKAEPVKPAEKKAVAAVAEVKLKKQPVVKKDAVKSEPVEASAKAGSWTVLVGNYVMEGSLAVDQAKIKKTGLEPVIKPGARKKAKMNRLLLVELADRSAAKVELDKLKKYTSDAFILDQGGKHYVYAGSYILDSRAASEKARLTAAGFTLTLKQEDVLIPSKNLTAGVFTDKKAAEAALKKLKDAGIKATLKQ